MPLGSKVRITSGTERGGAVEAECELEKGRDGGSEVDSGLVDVACWAKR